jgi:hypothetical protein
VKTDSQNDRELIKNLHEMCISKDKDGSNNINDNLDKN